MQKDLTKGRTMRTMLAFAMPMILGNLLQQCYNVADTLIVGRFLGSHALAAVGSSFTLMTFLTSILLGLCLGSGAVFSIRYGERDEHGLKEALFVSFVMIFVLTILLNMISILCIDEIIVFLQVPEALRIMMHEYLFVIFLGIMATFLYNYFASLLRSIGNSFTPLIFLAVSAVLNIVLDLYFVMQLHMGVAGAAWATVIAQYVSGFGIMLCTYIRYPHLRIHKQDCHMTYYCMKEIGSFSIITCAQQSIMNLGILMVQGLINSFGTTVMAAFAAAVKIDSFAYMPVQDFGNAFSTFIAQNYGAKKQERIKAGLKGAIMTTFLFCVVISVIVCLFARPLMLLFVKEQETAIIAQGVQYLRIEGACYCGIGCLFLLYGFYRSLEKPGMSLILTIISLGSRVILAYTLSAIPTIGVVGIWWSVPIGWLLADAVGLYYYRKRKHVLFKKMEPDAV